MSNIKNEEVLSDLRDELVNQRMNEKTYLKYESVRVYEDNNEEDCQYSFHDLYYDDGQIAPLKFLLNSDYYIEIVYSILGINNDKYKAYINDFDDIKNTSEVEFKDLQYISKINNNDCEFYEEEPIKQELNGFSKIAIDTKLSYLSNKVLITFDFSNDSEGDCKYYLNEINFWSAKVYISCDIYGLPTKEYREQHAMNITTWMEELIHSICLYEAKDFKLAVATAISAIDRFINDEFNYIIKYYHSIDLNGQGEHYRDTIRSRMVKLDKYKNQNKSYLYTKLPEIMKEYNFSESDSDLWKTLLEDWNKLRNLVDHALDGETLNDNLPRRYSDEFEKGYKSLLYIILKFINLIERNGDIDDDVIYSVD